MSVMGMHLQTQEMYQDLEKQHIHVSTSVCMHVHTHTHMHMHIGNFARRTAEPEGDLMTPRSQLITARLDSSQAD